jgi:hypothetical protein
MHHGQLGQPAMVLHEETKAWGSLCLTATYAVPARQFPNDFSEKSISSNRLFCRELSGTGGVTIGSALESA